MIEYIRTVYRRGSKRERLSSRETGTGPPEDPKVDGLSRLPGDPIDDEGTRPSDDPIAEHGPRAFDDPIVNEGIWPPGDPCAAGNPGPDSPPFTLVYRYSDMLPVKTGSPALDRTRAAGDVN